MRYAHAIRCFRIALVAFAVAGAVGAASPGAAQGDVLLRELAERLLVQAATPGGVPQTVELLPGQLPPGLPLMLPQPPGTRLVGAAVRRNGPEIAQIDIVFDVPQATDAARFYRDELPRQGFTLAPTTAIQAPARGFVATQGSATTTYFCRGTAPPFLSVSTYLRPNAPVDVRVRVDATSAGPCLTTASAPLPDTNGADRVPTLAAPQGVAVQIVAGGGITPSRYVNEANATTPRDAADLEAEFAAQLSAAGWMRTGGAASGPFAFSTWTLPGDGELTALLTVLETPGDDRRVLHIEVNAPARNP